MPDRTDILSWLHIGDLHMTLNRTASAPFLVRAKVFSGVPIEAVEVGVDDGNWAPMAPLPGAVATWQASTRHVERVVVRARDAHGRCDLDAVEPAGPGWSPPSRRADGSDDDRIGAWPEKGVPGTQLGPNRNGRQW